MQQQPFKGAGYPRPHDAWRDSVNEGDKAGESGNTSGNSVGANPSFARQTYRSPSMRTLRGRLIFWTLITTAGLFTVLFTGRDSSQWMAPGPLTSAHSRLMLDEKRCDACHVSPRLVSWNASTEGVKHDVATQSQLCLKCHGAELGNTYALNPHGASEQRLERIAQRIVGKVERAGNANVTNASTVREHPRFFDALACATCHKEHHGRQADLTSVTTGQCQTCHAKQFKSFGDGHPDFLKWIDRKQDVIAFNHATHAEKHFQQKQREFECRACHQDGLSSTSANQGEVVRTVGFDRACASCHEQTIHASSGAGVQLIALPTMNEETLAGGKESIERWPQGCVGDMEGVIPPWMELLLIPDDAAARALQELPASRDLGKLDLSDKKQVENARALSTGIRRLLKDVEDRGEVALDERWKAALPRATAEQRAALTPPADLIALSSKIWFGDEAWQMEAVSQTHDSVQSKARREEQSPSDAALNASKSTSGDNSLSATRAAKQPPSTQRVRLAEPTDWLLDEASEARLRQIREQLKSGGQSNANGAAAESKKPKPNIGPTNDLNVNPASRTGLPPSSTEATSIVSTRKVDVPMQPSIPSGGWKVDLASGKIWREPTGHADPVLKAAIEIALLGQNQNPSSAKTNNAMAAMGRQFLGPQGVGTCTTCHIGLFQPLTSNNNEFAWQSSKNLDTKGPTFFSHKPHMAQTKLQDCQSCHPLDSSLAKRDASTSGVMDAASNRSPLSGPLSPAASQSVFYARRSSDPPDAVSGLLAVRKANCTGCHTKSLAGDDCTLCHNYHWSGETHYSGGEEIKAE